MSFLSGVRDAFVPHRGNAYRPYALSKSSLSFFFAVVIVAEGLFVASLGGGNPSQMFLSAVAAAPQNGGGLTLALEQFTAVASNPIIATQSALMLVVLTLAVLLGINFFLHLRVQSRDILLPGLLIVGIALLLIVLNAWYVGVHGIA